MTKANRGIPQIIRAVALKMMRAIQRIAPIAFAFLILGWGYTAEGGSLAALVQPVAFIGVFGATSSLMVAKYGYKRFFSGLACSYRSVEFIQDGIRISLSVGLITFLLDAIVAFNQYLHGSEIYLISVGAGVVAMVFALLLAALFAVQQKSENV